MRHAANAGKGAAIKTGVSYLASSVAGCRGIVTVDADGQHAVEDAIAILRAVEASPRELVLGSRNFDLPHVPVRSRIGNKLTCQVARFCFGMKVSDTQTGLRGTGSENFPILLAIPFDRYEYEMEMLVRFQREGIPIREIPIQTIYLNENRSSKFNPLKDSLRVYSVILRAFLHR
jgi:glycosyltransferase involved in cell wall biosynthesis